MRESAASLRAELRINPFGRTKKIAFEDEGVIEKLIVCGMSSLVVSTYSLRMNKRINAICEQARKKYSVGNGLHIEILPSLKGDDSLDDRMSLYDRAE